MIVVDFIDYGGVPLYDIPDGYIVRYIVNLNGDIETAPFPYRALVPLFEELTSMNTLYRFQDSQKSTGFIESIRDLFRSAKSMKEQTDAEWEKFQRPTLDKIQELKEILLADGEFEEVKWIESAKGFGFVGFRKI